MWLQRAERCWTVYVRSDALYELKRIKRTDTAKSGVGLFKVMRKTVAKA